MKVLLLNGSPKNDGCTYTALAEVEKSLKKNGIETEWFHIGTQPIRGCVGCGKCWKTGVCIFDDDICNMVLAKIHEADGLIVGSPVYFSGPNGALCALLDRVFYASYGGKFAFKPAACVVSCRRGGASAAFDRLNKYFTIAQMPVISSQYWNAVHGNKPEHVLQDAEGLQIMRVLGNNMAWMLKNIKDGSPPPTPEEKREFTSFHDGK
ncbi:MAG: flavodoxin family protein [Oscillospiraceae bacterium]|nr:flavodoxin family protein [Oscillospiraceae bacterium]